MEKQGRGNRLQQVVSKAVNCVSGKNCYESIELAKEALISNHIQNDYRQGTGPVNIYECNDCHNWHFTSRGPMAHFLGDKEVVKRIEAERKLRKWSEGF